ncbi:MAG TPA: isochorismatase family protein [Thermoanaerobaculia bacterium]|jgi:nicotinamidase-related amidase|nr:isochorismatase family protein [Thermoanaerobaculia bacterium]
MKNALLVIDIQDSFKINPVRWAARSNPRFEENVTRLIATFREAGEPIVFVLHTDPDPGFRRADPELRLMSFLDRREGDPLLVKTTRNAFTSTDLESRLDAMGVERVVVCGISTEQCCETTTRVAADLGYEVDFVTEATLTFPIAGMTTEALIERTEAVLRGRFARIVSVDEVGAVFAT